MPFRASRSRSLIKAITFRILVVCFDLTVIYLFLGEWEQTLYLTLVSNLIRLLLYYGHERLWNRMTVGRQAE
jgi:adenylylsulfate kinase